MAGQTTSIMTPSPIYVGGQKIGDATEGKQTIDTGMGMIQTDAGVGFTVGRVTASVSIKTIIPRQGMAVDLFAKALAQTVFQIKLFHDGKFFTYSGFLKSASGEWSFSDGKCTGDFEFQGANVTAV